MKATGRWADLGVRLVSGLVLAGLGALSVWAGGWTFVAMTTAIFALMGWELAALTDTGARATRLVVAGLVAAGLLLAELGVAPALALAPLALAATPRRDRLVIALYALVLMISAHEFIRIDHQSALIVLWLVLVVVASDILGYFAGRLIGGPKFWPRVSPKKTWAGTVAGWLGAAAVGAALVAAGLAHPALIALSPLVALAGQMGDIAESLLKRRAGVKDSSHLIPGHGGVLDRFDALVGAIFMLWLWQLVLPLPIGG